MATIRYEIRMSPDGWRVRCRGVEGPAYSESAEAIRDTLFIAGELIRTGERVEVRLLEMDGPRQVWRKLEVQDARLYRS